MANTGKSLDDLINEVYDIVGPFKYSRDDLHLTEEKKQEIIKACETEQYKMFGEHKIDHIENIDGFKFFFDKGEWVMIRPSGTEPVLRVYCEAESYNGVDELLSAVRDTILS